MTAWCCGFVSVGETYKKGALIFRNGASTGFVINRIHQDATES